MQVIVPRADLGEQQPMVIGYYPDGTIIRDLSRLGENLALMTVPDSAVVPSKDVPGYVLAANWRSHAEVIANAEAKRRISEAFPDYSQSNAQADAVASITKFGADTEAWPTDAKDRKAAADAGWNYVNSVRQSSDAMVSGLPLDPTDDSHWPTKIPPVYIPPA
jgi:hypothetical protein